MPVPRDSIPSPSTPPEGAGLNDVLSGDMLLGEPSTLEEGLFTMVAGFVDHHIEWFLALLLIVTFLRLTYRSYQKQQQAIEKLWVFLLFFLSKRLMVVPLVYAFSAHDKTLSAHDRQKLLELRDDCRSISLQEKPSDRLLQEENLSQILYGYFAKLDRAGEIKPGSKLEAVVKDLEFMDSKLVQLQKLYNNVAANWNRAFSKAWSGAFLRLFRFRPFQPFTRPKS